MDSKILTYTIALVVAFAFSSCEKDANIPVPIENPKLVVYSYFSPTDSLMKVMVNSSDPIFDNEGGNSSDPLTTATVVVKVDGVSYTLPYNSAYLAYTLPTTSIPIIAGKYYELEVSAPGFETVTANTTMPVYNSFNFNVIVTGSSPPVSNESSYTPKIFDIRTEWSHFSSNDYYRCILNFYDIQPGSDTSFYEGWGKLFSYNDVASGKIIDNGDLYSTIYVDPYTNPHGIYADLIISTYDYHKFYESIMNYNPGDPFSEPTLVYSNVQNGYGIFAGYLRVTKKIHF